MQQKLHVCSDLRTQAQGSFWVGPFSHRWLQSPTLLGYCDSDKACSPVRRSPREEPQMTWWLWRKKKNRAKRTIKSYHKRHQSYGYKGYEAIYKSQDKDLKKQKTIWVGHAEGQRIEGITDIDSTSANAKHMASKWWRVYPCDYLLGREDEALTKYQFLMWRCPPWRPQVASTWLGAWHDHLSCNNLLYTHTHIHAHSYATRNHKTMKTRITCFDCCHSNSLNQKDKRNLTCIINSELSVLWSKRMFALYKYLGKRDAMRSVNLSREKGVVFFLRIFFFW